MKTKYALDVWGVEYAIMNGDCGHSIAWLGNIIRAGHNYEKVQNRVAALSSFMLDTEILPHQIFRFDADMRIIITCRKREMQRIIEYLNSHLQGIHFVIQRASYSKRYFIYLEDLNEEDISTEN